MKIAFITTSLTTGGAELMLLKLLQHIDRSSFDPQVISLMSKGEVGPRIEALGIPVLALDMNPGLPDPFKVATLFILLRKINPDLVQTWMYHADLLGGLAARLAGCQHIVWGLRNSNLDRKLTKRSTLIVVQACAALSGWLPTKILSCSARAAGVHASVGYRAEKIQVIPNGFDLERFQPDNLARVAVRSELGLSRETPLVGMMARYDLQKNHAGFIETAATIRRNMPNVHFVLAGGGIDGGNAILQAIIQSYGLSDCVHLLGRRDDMPRLMAALDVLASSSSFGEAFPNVLGEAMSCAVPCVVTDVGDSALIVCKTGRVVEVDDMVGLANSICECLKMTKAQYTELGESARARIADMFDIRNVVRQYESFYMALFENER
jgi:glycosyltransferase involved in cell wall biosynthesis